MIMLFFLFFSLIPFKIWASFPYFGRTSLGYHYFFQSQFEPSLGGDDASGFKKTYDASFSFIDDLLLGVGPFKFEPFSFHASYRYAQDWQSSSSQANLFWYQWFQDPSMKNFLFPTRSLLRTHDLATDLRFTWEKWQLGFFSKLSWNRVGSSLLGENLEETQTSSLGEIFSPYLSLLINQIYHVQFSLPFRSEVYQDARRLSNKSYSFGGEEGFFLSYRMRNGLLIRPWKSIFKADFEFQQFRYASIQYDKEWFWLNLALNLPFLGSTRLEPLFSFQMEPYLVQIPKIPKFQENPIQNEQDSTLHQRTDVSFLLGLNFFLYFTSQWSLQTHFDYQSSSAGTELPEFTTSEVNFFLKMIYSLPKTSTIVRRLQRFNDPIFIESQTCEIE